MGMRVQRQKSLKLLENLCVLTSSKLQYVTVERSHQSSNEASQISSGSGTYSCIVLFDKLTGNFIRARDRSCAAGRRGYCKHMAALCLP